ncbi:iron-sulfur cluster-binding protein [candidate division KSB1 bacterium]|nr:iron-sulfur cluster-binding protein [candidate division KSB1 bacterium]
MTEQKNFLKLSAQKAADETHRLKIAKAISTYDAVVNNTKASQFKNWEEARTLAAQIKNYTLAHLPELLEQFEKNFTAAGGKVFWAETGEEAAEYVVALAQQQHVRKVVKSKSMTTEEIQLNERLERSSIEVWESDLGELIVQLANEKPYHIVTPAMHKTKEEIGVLFNEQLHAPLTTNAEELTMIARRHLREAYITSGMGITGANFLIADAGAVVVTENEGNARLTMSCPPVHVVVAGIEKIIPRLADLSLFLPLLATSGTGQEITCYNSIVCGPRREGECDGPREMHVILLDNGRAQLYQRKRFREILRCIRCGACLNACPVYRTVGGHSYRTTYQGPIGSVITPHYNGFEKFQHLAAASSLCGACSSVCPVHIDIHHLLLENRALAITQNAPPFFGKMAMRVFAWVMSRPQRLQLMRRLVRMVQPLAPQRLREPRMSKKSFRELWRANEYGA